MNVLSLFDGISCGQLALKRGGIPVDNYYASEIDKNAIKVTMQNFPHTIQLGDVDAIRFSDYAGKIDLLLGGSPCQDLSIAKADRQGLDGERSGLFWKYVEALEIVQPTYFLFENVASMSKVARQTITEILKVNPILIDSALVSAQGRKRLYWTNIPNITQPEDRGILLAGIIESGVVDRGKAYCIDASYWKGGNLKSYFEKHRRQLVFTDAEYLAARIVGRKINERGVRDDNNPNLKAVQRVEVNKNPQKSNTLTAVTKKNVIVNSELVRILTPLECERLQTLPDNYTAGISNRQRYKAIGNGWTVNVITHILSSIPKI